MYSVRGMDFPAFFYWKNDEITNEQLMGHTNLQTTMTYIYMDDTTVNDLYRKHSA